MLQSPPYKDASKGGIHDVFSPGAGVGTSCSDFGKQKLQQHLAQLKSELQDAGDGSCQWTIQEELGKGACGVVFKVGGPWLPSGVADPKCPLQGGPLQGTHSLYMWSCQNHLTINIV